MACLPPRRGAKEEELGGACELRGRGGVGDEAVGGAGVVVGGPRVKTEETHGRDGAGGAGEDGECVCGGAWRGFG